MFVCPMSSVAAIVVEGSGGNGDFIGGWGGVKS